MQSVLTLLLKAKRWAWLIGAAVLAVLAAIVRIKTLEYQRDRARYRAEHAEAQLDWHADVAEADSEISNEYSELRERAEADKEAGKVPENLRDPDRW